MAARFVTLDGNEAVAYVAHRLSEVIAIYPITPSSAMGEWADQWSSERRPNLWGTVPKVVEMQSEGGAAGAVHGSLQSGALTTTFTASQGLLLMIPNMYKIAGELTAAVIHVAARSVAAQALSIFGDHSDVMACRATGWAMLCSGSVQEAMDMAAISQMATLSSRIPFLHFFDGFRTSHEVSKIALLEDDDLRALIDEDAVRAHRARKLSPDHPVLRGTAQNPDVFFQARETVNRFYDVCPDLTQRAMDQFGERVGRHYKLFEYHGHPEAERVVVLMGSGAETAHETVDHLVAQDERVGLLKVRLFRPFDGRRFAEALPRSARAIAVLDRTKEPGALGEPLYLDCVTALAEHIDAVAHEGASARGSLPTIVGGRYGLSSKEFTPAMVMGVFDHLATARPRNHFTVGIRDDVTHTSLFYEDGCSIEPPDVVQAVFWGLGADGTVGANKSAIKIIGEGTPGFAQGYFVYDSRKSGAVTISHLRFGPRPIRASYLVEKASFVGCHQWNLLERYDVLGSIVDGGTFLLNSPFGPDAVWENLPKPIQEAILAKGLKLYVIDGYRVAKECGLGGRINTVMQTCFFVLSKVLPLEEAVAAIKYAIKKDYGGQGEEIVSRNVRAVDRALEEMHEVPIAGLAVNGLAQLPPVPGAAPDFVRNVLGAVIAGKGDQLPVSALPVDGTYPTATSRWEKRNIAREIPVWEPDLCIQCGKCTMVCPHSVIRIKVFSPDALAGSPPTFKTMAAKDREFDGLRYSIQVAPEDCTGCAICVDICPARSKSATKIKALNMKPQPPLREPEAENWQFFVGLPELDRRLIKEGSIRQQQIQEPLFEFPSACSGCGETPYIKLATQLFGDRMVVANATGCSSIYGGNLPTTPWSQNADGRGPAWSNSLFEDNAEFGLGMRLAIDKQHEMASELVLHLKDSLGEELVESLIGADQRSEAGIYEQRERVKALKAKLASLARPEARRLEDVADMLVRKSVWIIGGDGWAYDIGFGGLDHVLASGADVNVLVLDTEVYSNTGGQMSKSTPRAAVAKFAAGGKPGPKKDLGRIAMTYGNVYVAQVAMGARDEHTLKAFLEAEAYPGPSIIIAYSHCIAHGIVMEHGMRNQKAAVESGHWLLYRHHPERAENGENPLILDSKAPKIPVSQYLEMENRFRMLVATRPGEARGLFREVQQDVNRNWQTYQALAGQHPGEKPAESGNK
ncbi:MAG: pyruvate:ferredoxin (flavodoxin) oxidoreductase [bacterium]